MRQGNVESPPRLFDAAISEMANAIGLAQRHQAKQRALVEQLERERNVPNTVLGRADLPPLELEVQNTERAEMLTEMRHRTSVQRTDGRPTGPALPKLSLSPRRSAVQGNDTPRNTSRVTPRMTPRITPRLSPRDRPPPREDRVPFDFQGTYVLCSDMIRRFALAAEAGGFVSASCSTDATVAVAADTILAHNQKTVMRYPSQCAAAKDRRATQAVSDLKALRLSMDRHCSHPRVRLALLLLGWGAEEAWTPPKRLMCLRWLAWCHSHTPVLGKYLSLQSVDNLLHYMHHIKMLRDDGVSILHVASRDAYIRRGRGVHFDLLLLSWTKLWGSWETKENAARLQWEFARRRVEPHE